MAHSTNPIKGKLLLLSASLVLTLLLAEWGLRLFWPQETLDRAMARAPRMFSPSPILPYALTPGAVTQLVSEEFVTPIRINSHGYRDDEFELEKSGQFRILAIGDSFTFGYTTPASESYPTLLEKQLAQETSRQIEVINAGFAACYYPDTYYLYLKEIGLKLKPDLILIGFYIGNDIDHFAVTENKWVATDDNGLPTQIQSTIAVVENGYLAGKDRRPRHRLPFVRNSHLAQAVIEAIRGLRRSDPPIFFNHWIYRQHYLDRTTERVELVQRLLAAMAGLARQHEIPLLVVMIPTIEQVYPNRFPFDDYPFMKHRDLEKPQRVFARFFQAKHIPCLDLLPVFREQPKQPMLYYWQDQHWNAAGNRVASRAISSFIQENHYVGDATQTSRP